MKQRQSTAYIAYIAKVGILSAIAAAVMRLDFPLWFAPSFYKLDFSEVIALIGGFALGPVAGILIELLKNLLEILLFGTSTAFVGEFANFVTSCAFVVPAALLYKFHKSRKDAVLGMALGAACLVIAGGVINYFVLIPAFSKLYNMPIDTIIAMGTSVNSHIDNLLTLILFAVVPFNIFKAVVVSVLTFFLYKRLSFLLKGKGTAKAATPKV